MYIYIVCTISNRSILSRYMYPYTWWIISHYFIYLLVKDALEIRRSLVTSVYPIFSGYMRGVFFMVQNFCSDFCEGCFEISAFPLAVCQVGLNAYGSRKIRMHWTVLNYYGRWRYCYDGIKYKYRLGLASMSHSDYVSVYKIVLPPTYLYQKFVQNVDHLGYPLCQSISVTCIRVMCIEHTGPNPENKIIIYQGTRYCARTGGMWA